MKELIAVRPTPMDGQSVNTVNARELHAFLEVGKDFSNWIKAQVERARLVENRDFVVFAQKGENPKGGRAAIEYHLTIESAKHVAMMSGTDKGFIVRDYFIECERVAHSKAIDPMTALNDPAAMRGLLLTYTEKVLALEEEKKVMVPIVAAFERIAMADGSICVTDAAKVLQVQPKALFFWLQANHWIYRRPGGKGWVAYQDKIQSGYLEHKVTVVSRGDGSQKTIEQVLVTPKGITKLSRIFVEVAA